MKLLTTLAALTFSVISSAQSLPIDAEVHYFDGNLYAEPVRHETEYLSIPKGSKVTILEYAEGPFFKVSYQDSVGYLSFLYFSDNDDVRNVYYENKYQDNPSMQRLMKRYDAYTAKRIIDGNYWLGMSDDMAIESLGRPSDKNTDVGSWGTHEQWVYRGRGLNLYFENGILTSYQER